MWPPPVRSDFSRSESTTTTCSNQRPGGTEVSIYRDSSRSCSHLSSFYVAADEWPWDAECTSSVHEKDVLRLLERLTARLDHVASTATSGSRTKRQLGELEPLWEVICGSGVLRSKLLPLWASTGDPHAAAVAMHLVSLLTQVYHVHLPSPPLHQPSLFSGGSSTGSSAAATTIAAHLMTEDAWLVRSVLSTWLRCGSRSRSFTGTSTNTRANTADSHLHNPARLWSLGRLRDIANLARSGSTLFATRLLFHDANTAQALEDCAGDSKPLQCSTAGNLIELLLRVGDGGDDDDLTTTGATSQSTLSEISPCERGSRGGCLLSDAREASEHSLHMMAGLLEVVSVLLLEDACAFAPVDRREVAAFMVANGEVSAAHVSQDHGGGSGRVGGRDTNFGASRRPTALRTLLICFFSIMRSHSTLPTPSHLQRSWHSHNSQLSVSEGLQCGLCNVECVLTLGCECASALVALLSGMSGGSDPAVTTAAAAVPGPYWHQLLHILADSGAALSLVSLLRCGRAPSTGLQRVATHLLSQLLDATTGTAQTVAPCRPMLQHMWGATGLFTAMKVILDCGSIAVRTLTELLYSRSHKVVSRSGGSNGGGCSANRSSLESHVDAAHFQDRNRPPQNAAIAINVVDDRQSNHQPQLSTSQYYEYYDIQGISSLMTCESASASMDTSLCSNTAGSLSAIMGDTTPEAVRARASAQDSQAAREWDEVLAAVAAMRDVVGCLSRAVAETEKVSHTGDDATQDVGVRSSLRLSELIWVRCFHSGILNTLGEVLDMCTSNDALSGAFTILASHRRGNSWHRLWSTAATFQQTHGRDSGTAVLDAESSSSSAATAEEETLRMLMEVELYIAQLFSFFLQRSGDSAGQREVLCSCQLDMRALLIHFVEHISAHYLTETLGPGVVALRQSLCALCAVCTRESDECRISDAGSNPPSKCPPPETNVGSNRGGRANALLGRAQRAMRTKETFHHRCIDLLASLNGLSTFARMISHPVVHCDFVPLASLKLIGIVLTSPCLPTATRLHCFTGTHFLLESLISTVTGADWGVQVQVPLLATAEMAPAREACRSMQRLLQISGLRLLRWWLSTSTVHGDNGEDDAAARLDVISPLLASRALVKFICTTVSPNRAAAGGGHASATADARQFSARVVEGAAPMLSAEPTLQRYSELPSAAIPPDVRVPSMWWRQSSTCGNTCSRADLSDANGGNAESHASSPVNTRSHSGPNGNIPAVGGATVAVAPSARTAPIQIYAEEPVTTGCAQLRRWMVAERVPQPTEVKAAAVGSPHMASGVRETVLLHHLDSGTARAGWPRLWENDSDAFETRKLDEIIQLVHEMAKYWRSASAAVHAAQSDQWLIIFTALARLFNALMARKLARGGGGGTDVSVAEARAASGSAGYLWSGRSGGIDPVVEEHLFLSTLDVLLCMLNYQDGQRTMPVSPTRQAVTDARTATEAVAANMPEVCMTHPIGGLLEGHSRSWVSLPESQPYLLASVHTTYFSLVTDPVPTYHSSAAYYDHTDRDTIGATEASERVSHTQSHYRWPRAQSESHIARTTTPVVTLQQLMRLSLAREVTLSDLDILVHLAHRECKPRNPALATTLTALPSLPLLVRGEHIINDGLSLTAHHIIEKTEWLVSHIKAK